MAYYPAHVPALVDVEELRQYLEDELRRIAAEFQQTEILNFRILNTEPAKRMDGMLVFADGVNWDPGSGAGLYERRSGAWQKL